MENSTPKSYSASSIGTSIIQFIPSGPITPASRKAIRSHVTAETRRRQRQQRQLALQVKTTSTKSTFLEDNLCRCSIVDATQPTDTGPSKPKSRSVLQREQMADSYKICSKCRGVQFAALSRQGQLRLAKAHPAVFNLLQFELDPFHSMPDLPSRLSSFDSRLIDELKFYLITFLTPGILKTGLLPAVTKEPVLLMSWLYMSSALLSGVKGESEGPLASAIKKEVIHLINIRLGSPTTAYTTETISAIGNLSVGIWNFGSPTALQEVDAHEKGLMSLLHQGPGWIPSEADKLGRALNKILVIHEMVQSTLTQTPIDEFLMVNFGRLPQPVSDSEYISESPLFCPRNDFYSVKTSKDCNEATLRILRATKLLIDATLAIDPIPGEQREANLKRFETIKCDLNMLLSDTSPAEDSVYESCRLAALLTTRAIETGTPFKDLDIDLVNQLKVAMQSTDIGDSWGKMSGVLFWVALVGTAVAVIGRPQHSFMDSVLRRAMFELTYKSPVFETTTVATTRFHYIQANLQNNIRQESTRLESQPTIITVR